MEKGSLSVHGAEKLPKCIKDLTPFPLPSEIPSLQGAILVVPVGMKIRPENSVTSVGLFFLASLRHRVPCPPALNH
jgi:hypothetical protein